MKQIDILLADDHTLIRRGLRRLMERMSDMRVIGEAGDGRAAVALAVELRPDIVIMDIVMPELNGIDATRQIIAQTPDVKVVVLTAFADERRTAEIFAAGASGCVTKAGAFDELCVAIRAVASGGVYVSPELARHIAAAFVRADANPSAPSQTVRLARREREVLQLLAEGKSPKQIAGILQVSIKTVETHKHNLMRKLEINNVADLTKYAIRAGITALEN